MRRFIRAAHDAARRPTEAPTEGRSKISAMSVAHSRRNLAYRVVATRQQLERNAHALLRQVLKNRHTKRFLKAELQLVSIDAEPPSDVIPPPISAVICTGSGALSVPGVGGLG